MQFGFKELENIYHSYNRKALISPDPLQFLSSYSQPQDIEVVALIASAIAYGRVQQILKSVSTILKIMGKSPSSFILNNKNCDFRRYFSNFKHRFTSGDELSSFLTGIKNTINNYNSLENCFMQYHSEKNNNIIPALTMFCEHLNSNFKNNSSYLFPSPKKGSACKRPMLFLRWMIRNDEVDPGTWTKISPAKLIIPLDTHMHQFAITAKFTKRKNPNLATAIEITNTFRKINPIDPVKYDFALTRFGIRNDMKINSLWQK